MGIIGWSAVILVESHGPSVPTAGLARRALFGPLLCTSERISSSGIGIAVGSTRGLVVPVLRNVDQMSFADIEASIADFGVRAQSGGLGLDELTGGTFTLSNGGVFGSMLSTPILNPPQSGILGMHNTTERPIVEDGEIVIRPMMYLALSYDHRIIDGREAVQFLVTIKEALEDPGRMLLEV